MNSKSYPFLNKPRFGVMPLSIFIWQPMEDARQREKYWLEKCNAANKLAKYFPRAFRRINPSNWGSVDWKNEFRLAMSHESEFVENEFMMAVIERDVEKLNSIIAQKIDERNFFFDIFFANDTFLYWSNTSHEIRLIIWEVILQIVRDTNQLFKLSMITCQSEELVNLLYTAITDVNAITDEDRVYNADSFLYIACIQGYKKIVQSLLNRNAEVNPVRRRQPLVAASEYGDIETVKLLIAYGARVNFQHLHIPLRKACEFGHLDIVNLLLECGADANETDGEYESPLHVACANGHLEIVRLLLSKGAMVEYRDEEIDILPIDRANNSEIVRLLLAYGAQYNVENADEALPLHYACEFGRLDVVNLLLDLGSDINAVTFCGKTPLSIACHTGIFDLVKLLIERGANVNPQNTRGDIKNPLLKAYQENHLAIIKLLLKHKANLFALDLWDLTARIDPKIKMYLLEKCIKIMSRFDSPEAVIYRKKLAAKYHSHIVPLCDSNLDLLLLLAILTRQSSDEIHRVINLGASIHGSEKYSHSPLDLAAQFSPEASHIINNLMELQEAECKSLMLQFFPDQEVSSLFDNDSEDDYFNPRKRPHSPS